MFFFLPHLNLHKKKSCIYLFSSGRIHPLFLPFFSSYIVSHPAPPPPPLPSFPSSLSCLIGASVFTLPRSARRRVYICVDEHFCFFSFFFFSIFSFFFPCFFLLFFRFFLLLFFPSWISSFLEAPPPPFPRRASSLSGRGWAPPRGHEPTLQVRSARKERTKKKKKERERKRVEAVHE